MWAVAFIVLVAPIRAGATPWAWHHISASGRSPLGRQGHAAVEAGDKIYVIGGCVQDIRCFSDVHILDTDTSQWTEATVSGEAPDPRGGHTATRVGNSIFVFGGASSEDTYGDVHRLDLSRGHWTRVEVRADQGGRQGPGRRTNHAAAADSRGQIYMFGGYDENGDFHNDLWILSTSPSLAWVRPSPNGPVPAARESHSLSIVDRDLIMFGGYTASGRAVNDVHIYSLETQGWSRLEIGGVPPPPRQAHSAARHGHEIIMAGGCDVSDAEPRCFNDVWSLNLFHMRWINRSSNTLAWSPREGHTATFVRGKMFTIGGCQLGAKCFADVAALDTSEPCPASCGNNGVCINQQFCKCNVGFSGHDCLEPFTCGQDCGSHGMCSPDGQCVCEAGWTGSDCSKTAHCPGSPSMCGGRGTCLESGMCQCDAGFSGADCTQLARGNCLAGCSGHGQCGANSQCVCFAGWSGEVCSIRVDNLHPERCPHSCCGHGVCKTDHSCLCEVGWYGPMCAYSKAAWTAAQQQRATRFLQEAQAKRGQAERSRALADAMANAAAASGTGVTADMVAQMGQLKNDAIRLGADAEAAEVASSMDPTTEELAALGFRASCTVPSGWYASAGHSPQDGVVFLNEGYVPDAAAQLKSYGVTQIDHALVSRGSAGAAPGPAPAGGGCQDDCHYQGLCDNGKCYCQPGYYGTACEQKKDLDSGTLSLGVVCYVALAILLLSFCVTTCVLYATQGGGSDDGLA